MKKYIFIAIPLSLLSAAAFCQKELKRDSATRHKEAKADVLIQKNTIYDKAEIKTGPPIMTAKDKPVTVRQKIKYKHSGKKNKKKITKK